MKRRYSAIMVFALVGAVSLAGCYGGAEEVGAIAQSQINNGWHSYRSVVLTFANGKSFATLYLFNKPVGSYVTGKEYWYINLGNLSYLGSSALSIVTTDSDSTTAPPDPGYSNEQSFTLAELSNWGSHWTTDPLSGGSLYTSSASAQSLRVTTGGSPTQVTNLAWYQVLPTNSTPANITPNGTFSVASSITVPTGYYGYDITQAP